MRRELLKCLNHEVVQFVELCRREDPALAVNSEWTAKDVAAHITFWHESFARNLRDAAAGVSATPLRGTYAELNARCMREMRPLTMDQITERLICAHRTVEELILEPSLTEIAYRHGSRPYGPDEHLEVVASHIHAHAARIEKAARLRRA